MKLLLTGGAGFQGSHLAEKWVRDGHKVTVLNTLSEEAERNIAGIDGDLTLTWGSVTDREVVEKTVRGHDVVVHMAARINVDESLADPRGFLNVNVAGTMNILEAVRREENRMIYASSCEVYGGSEHSLLTEGSGLQPASPYAASKAAADRMCLAYHLSFGLDVTIVRPCNIYGVRQKSGPGGAVIPIFVDLAAAGKPLRVFGTGEQRREYMHVNDLVQAYDLILRNGKLAGEALNVGTNETPSIREIAEFIGDRAGVSVVSEPPRPGEVPGFRLDSSKIGAQGFEPQTRFWEGLSSYLDEFLNSSSLVE